VSRKEVGRRVGLSYSEIEMGFLKKVYLTLRDFSNHPLKRHAKFKAIIEFCMGQLAIRWIPGDVCVPFPNGAKLLVPPMMKGSFHFLFLGLYEYEEMSFLLHFLRPDDLFVDVGANIGAYTVLAGACAGCKTISFEPSASNYKYLVDNIHLNNLQGRSSGVNMAIGNEKGVIQFTEGLGTEGYVTSGGGHLKTVPVQVDKLDDLLKDKDPVVIKIDVEGFESNVIAGARQVLRSQSLRCILIEKAGNAERYGINENSLHAEIMEASFVPFRYSPGNRTLIEVSNDYHGVVIYLRDQKEACERLRHADLFSFGRIKL
jgi:FkbM family methyltransferase